MIDENRIALLIPAYNEEIQIEQVISSKPEFVDQVIVVDDASTDKTGEVLKKQKSENPELTVLRHDENRGAGAAIKTGYHWCLENDVADIIVTADGDGQMDSTEIKKLVTPLTQNGVEFTKGNRFARGDAWKQMPRHRFLGNALLSLLTKISSGYWHVADFQTGFTAGKTEKLKDIDWSLLYNRYGYPNHRLILLNAANVSIQDIPVKSVYNIGEESGMKIWSIIFTIPWLLLKAFMWRLKEKYIIRDFHPLVFFYFFGFVFTLASIFLFGRVFYHWLWLGDQIPPINALAAMFSFMSATQFILFAMWFDMEANKDLK